MRLHRLLLLFVVITSLTGCRQASHVKYESGSIASIFSKAREQNKKVFILFEDSQCGNCSLFASLLDSQSVTARELNKNYISYKVNVQDSLALELAQIVKCPSYPFPYFFDNEGNLEAFGFPSGAVFDVQHLTDISINDFLFQQLFRLPVSQDQYKQLVSQNVKAYLLMQAADRNTGSIKQAYELNKSSLALAVYPYNLHLHEALSKQLHLPVATASYSLPRFTNSDRLIYRNLHFDSSYFSRLPQHNSTSAGLSYQVIPESLLLSDVDSSASIPFRFAIKNKGKAPLNIQKVGHDCSCINVEWAKTAVQPDSITYISGVFKTPPSGSFKREIYLHTNSPAKPMKILSLAGNVK